MAGLKHPYLHLRRRKRKQHAVLGRNEIDGVDCAEHHNIAS